MTGANGNKLFWKEWQDILLMEYENRLTTPGVKGQWITPASKTLTILFLQVKGFAVSSADILAAAIRTIRENDAPQSGIPSSVKEYDSISMIGHRIGMVDNSALLKQYLQDVRTVLKPEGQILITCLDLYGANEPEHRSNPALIYKQFQQVNLIGPFFHIWLVKADTLKSQADAANWHCELIYRQDDSNYLARLYLAESK